MNFADGLPGVLIRRDKNDLSIWVEKKNAQKLAPAVTGTPEDRYSDLVIIH